MTAARILPQYGYGWMRGEHSIDVPEPFFVEINGDKNTAKAEALATTLTGRVVDERHEYNGLKIILVARAVGAVRTYNVRVWPDDRSYVDHEQPDSPSTSSKIVIGFATIEF